MDRDQSNKNIDRNFQMYPGVTAGFGLLSDKIVRQILEFERLSPASTKQRLHRYILRNYTPGGRRIVYQRPKTVPIDRRRRLRPQQVDEMRASRATGKVSMRQLARRFRVSVSTVSNIINGRNWKS